MHKLECMACHKEQWADDKDGQCICCGAIGMLVDVEWGEEEEEEEKEDEDKN